MESRRFIDIVLADVIKAYREHRWAATVEIVFNKEGEFRAKTDEDSHMWVQEDFYGIPYRVDPYQKELYKIEVTEE